MLERGILSPSPLTTEFNVAMSLFKFAPSTVLVTLLDNTYEPIANWSFLKAYPVSWHVSDLDANANEVVIEHLELTYQTMLTVRL